MSYESKRMDLVSVPVVKGKPGQIRNIFIIGMKLKLQEIV